MAEQATPAGAGDRFPSVEREFERGPGAGGSSSDGSSSLGDLLRTGMRLLGVVLMVVALLTALPLAKMWRRRRRLRRLADGDISAAWAEVVDQLRDSGNPPDPTLTPTELATATDEAMEPLAAVYGESIYHPVRGGTPARIATATAALTATEQRLRSRRSRGQRVAMAYQLRSLRPDWLKLRPGRKKERTPS